MKKASKIKTAPTNLEKQLEQLKQLKPEELRKRWQTVFGSNPPPKIRSSLMIQAIARRLQEKALGGLKPSTQRLLQKVSQHARVGSEVPTTEKGSATSRHGSGPGMARQQASGERPEGRFPLSL